jgi:hypothetical protein
MTTLVSEFFLKIVLFVGINCDTIWNFFGGVITTAVIDTKLARPSIDAERLLHATSPESERVYQALKRTTSYHLHRLYRHLHYRAGTPPPLSALPTQYH